MTANPIQNIARALCSLLSALVLASCSMSAVAPTDEDASTGISEGSPRLIIRGTVSDTVNQPLQGIYVAVYGVREETEKDILTYNYAFTDSAGHYTIIRYRGRLLPTELTVVATDSAGIYAEQVLFAPITYDSIRTNDGISAPFNGYVTADFLLSPSH